MDHQNDYRYTIINIVLSVLNRSEIKSHVSETYCRNQMTFYATVKSLVDAGSLNENIPCPSGFKFFGLK